MSNTAKYRARLDQMDANLLEAWNGVSTQDLAALQKGFALLARDCPASALVQIVKHCPCGRGELFAAAAINRAFAGMLTSRIELEELENPS